MVLNCNNYETFLSKLAHYSWRRFGAQPLPFHPLKWVALIIGPPIVVWIIGIPPPNRYPLKYPCHDSRAQLTSDHRNNTLLPGGIGYETLRIGVQGIDVDDAGQIMLPVDRWTDGCPCLDQSGTQLSCGSPG